MEPSRHANQHELMNEFVLDLFLSENGEDDDLGPMLTYDELMEALDEGVIPEQVVVWEPFAEYEASQLSDFIDNTHFALVAYTFEFMKLRSEGKLTFNYDLTEE